MAFSLQDVRVTSRRSRGGDPILYPRLLRDSSILPKISIATDYFESMLGRERRELDTEVLVQFFGDHKLARCVVACLGRAYRFRQPELAQAVPASSFARLREAGLDSPSALRFGLYDYLNEERHGFLPQNARDHVLGLLEGRYGLVPGELEPLYTLDDPERALLTKQGGTPRPADVVAQYNAGALETLLRYARNVDLALDLPDANARDAAAGICATNGVDVDVADGPGTVRLIGRQDALGSWARFGRKVARSVVQLVECAGRGMQSAVASMVWKDRTASLRLTPELLGMLGGAGAGAGFDALPGWDHASVADMPRSAPSARGVAGVRQAPQPQAWQPGVVVPDRLVRVGDRQYLVVAVRSPAHAARLSTIAPAVNCGEPLVFAGDASVLGPLRDAGARTVESPTWDLGRVVEALAADVAVA